jgi:DNA-binding NarL/FixJ family response regulator
MKIVILEDHPMSGSIYSRLLNENDFDYVKEFIDTEECYEFALSNKDINVFILDFNITESIKYKISDGGVLVNKIRKVSPFAKFVIITLVYSGLELFNIKKKSNPNGIWYKGDTTPVNFVDNLRRVIEGFKIYTPSVQFKFDKIESYKEFDSLDLEILYYISKGYKNLDLPNVINTSLSNINARKTNIKITLGIEGKNDQILMEKCRYLNID